MGGPGLPKLFHWDLSCLLSVIKAPWLLPGSNSPASSSASCVLGISSEALLPPFSLKGSWVWREAPSSQGKKWKCLEISTGKGRVRGADAGGRTPGPFVHFRISTVTLGHADVSSNKH